MAQPIVLPSFLVDRLNRDRQVVQGKRKQLEDLKNSIRDTERLKSECVKLVEEGESWDIEIPTASTSASPLGYLPSRISRPKLITLCLNPSFTTPIFSSSMDLTNGDREDVYYADYLPSQAIDVLTRRVNGKDFFYTDFEEHVKKISTSEQPLSNLIAEEWKIGEDGKVLNEEGLPVFDIREDEDEIVSRTSAVNSMSMLNGSRSSDSGNMKTNLAKRYIISNKSGWKPGGSGKGKEKEEDSPIVSGNKSMINDPKLRISEGTHRLLDQLELEEEMQEDEVTQEVADEEDEHRRTEEGEEEKEETSESEDEKEERRRIENMKRTFLERQRRKEEAKKILEERERIEKREKEEKEEGMKKLRELTDGYLKRKQAEKVEKDEMMKEKEKKSISPLTKLSHALPNLPFQPPDISTEPLSQPLYPPSPSPIPQSVKKEEPKDPYARKLAALKAANALRRASDHTRDNLPFLPLNTPSPTPSPSHTPSHLTPASSIQSSPTRSQFGHELGRSFTAPSTPITAIPGYMNDEKGTKLRPALKRRGTETPPKHVHFDFPKGMKVPDSETKATAPRKNAIVLGWKDDSQQSNKKIEEVELSEFEVEEDEEPAVFVSQGFESGLSLERMKAKEARRKRVGINLGDVLEKVWNGNGGEHIKLKETKEESATAKKMNGGERDRFGVKKERPVKDVVVEREPPVMLNRPAKRPSKYAHTTPPSIPRPSTQLNDNDSTSVTSTTSTSSPRISDTDDLHDLLALDNPRSILELGNEEEDSTYSYSDYSESEDEELERALEARKIAQEYHLKRLGLGAGQGTGPLGGDGPGDEVGEFVPADYTLTDPKYQHRGPDNSVFRTGRKMPGLLVPSFEADANGMVLDNVDAILNKEDRLEIQKRLEEIARGDPLTEKEQKKFSAPRVEERPPTLKPRNTVGQTTMASPTSGTHIQDLSSTPKPLSAATLPNPSPIPEVSKSSIQHVENAIMAKADNTVSSDPVLPKKRVSRFKAQRKGEINDD